MSIPIYQVDAFTDQPFRGNPAAVCLLPQRTTDQWLQNVAAEMNLSETAYIVPRGESQTAFDLRWFTPKLEVDLCGHATLASAHVLWEVQRVPHAATIDFHTRSGVLRAAHRAGRIEARFPTECGNTSRTARRTCRELGHLAGVCGQEPLRSSGGGPVRIGFEKSAARFPPVGRPSYAGAHRHLPLGRTALRLRIPLLRPRAGIDEDPVTGSAHCTLAGFWQERLGKSEFVAYQASPRGGVVHVRIEGDRVCLGGTAVTVLRGELV